MYKIASPDGFIPITDYGGFGYRIRDILAADGKSKIVYVTTEFNDPTFRYRFYNFRQSLENSERYSLVCFERNEIPRLLKYIGNFSAVVLQRTALDNNVDNLIYLCKQKKIPLIFDIDDLIYNPDTVVTYVNHMRDEKKELDLLHGWLMNSVSLYLVAKQCDCFICTTPFLENCIKEDFGKQVHIIPNYYNREQETISEDILTHREYDKSRFCIGYFSGSPSHQADFGICEKSLVSLLSKYDNMYLKIVGYMNLSSELEALKQKGKVIFKPFCSYKQLQYEIGEADVNIAPLVDCVFNDCKSELKFFEAAIVKVPSVVSSVGVYKSVIKNGENGCLCKPYEWHEALERLYHNEKLRKSIAENAYTYARENYNYRNFAKLIETTFYDIISGYKSGRLCK